MKHDWHSTIWILKLLLYYELHTKKPFIQEKVFYLLKVQSRENHNVLKINIKPQSPFSHVMNLTEI
jgi:hypothetical protein